ncbi:uncharacterized protein LOC143585477 [Bidens hawaiensis]|uniref:uncharacterized protein LOC143585477 n=1 Tax=Bidens hawaiensis TaxID=980011 RepID=UPI0040491584
MSRFSRLKWKQWRKFLPCFFTMVTAKKPGLEIDEVLCVSLNMPGAKKEDVLSMISADNNLNITCKIRDQIYKAGMKLPDYFDRARALSFELEDGSLKLNLPLVKSTNAIPKNVMKVFFEHDCTTFFCAMMDQPIHEGNIRAAMAELRSKLISFTLYQKETLESIYLEGSMPGLEKMEVTSEAVCVSLNMPGFEIGDVQCRFVEYNTLRIEGKKKKGDCAEHFMTGIRTPEGFHGEDHMIKREMEDGVYKVTLPRVDVISEEAKRMTGAFFYKVRRY